MLGSPWIHDSLSAKAGIGMLCVFLRKGKEKGYKCLSPHNKRPRIWGYPLFLALSGCWVQPILDLLFLSFYTQFQNQLSKLGASTITNHLSTTPKNKTVHFPFFSLTISCECCTSSSIIQSLNSNRISRLCVANMRKFSSGFQKSC